MAHKLALTGAIGSGKSMLLGLFRKLGVPVWSADAYVADLYDTNKEVHTYVAELSHRFGFDDKIDGCFKDAFVDVEKRGQKNTGVHPGPNLRQCLASLVVVTPGLLEALTDFLYPMVREELQAFYRGKVNESKGCLKVAEVPLLFEADMAALPDEVWYTVHPNARAQAVSRGGEEGKAMVTELYDFLQQRHWPLCLKAPKIDRIINMDQPLGVLEGWVRGQLERQESRAQR